MSESDKLTQLKKVLLDEDREAHRQLTAEVDEINKQINVREELESKVNPIIDSKIEVFQKSIPEKLGPTITAALRKQISEAQDQVLDILYPIIGKLIKKYIRMELQILSEKIDTQFKNAFSWEGWVRRIKGWFGGAKESQLMVRDLAAPQLEEMFVIEKDSGILKGSYSRNNTVDKDIIAGMLTAIKSFVEDAFSKGSEELEMIEYESYKIHLFTFQSFFIAVVVSGIVNAQFKAEMHDAVMDFSGKFLNKTKEIAQHEHEPYISKQLKQYFDGTDI